MAATTLGDVQNRVAALASLHHDTFVPVTDLEFDSLDTLRIAGEPHHLRPAAQSAVASRLGVPITYLRRCPPWLQKSNMGHWLTKEVNSELFLRFDGGDVRALFTPRYRPLDHSAVLERLGELGYGPATRVLCQLDGEFMNLSIPDGDRTFTVGTGDRITPGISISNSEVGFASLSLSAYFLRLVCTNGLVSKSEMTASYRHVSTRILDDFPEALGKVARELDRKKDQFRISVDSRVANPLSTIASFNRQFTLGKTEQEAVEWGWAHEPTPTMFGIVNAYTKGAQREKLPVEASYHLQRVGGAILSMVQ